MGIEVISEALQYHAADNAELRTTGGRRSLCEFSYLRQELHLPRAQPTAVVKTVAAPTLQEPQSALIRHRCASVGRNPALQINELFRFGRGGAIRTPDPLRPRHRGVRNPPGP